MRLKQDSQVTTSQPIIDGFDGLMARINALGELAWFPSFFILLLFLAIETAPVFAKIMAPKGAYDLKLEEQEDAIEVWVTQQKKSKSCSIGHRYNTQRKKYTTISVKTKKYMIIKSKKQKNSSESSQMLFIKNKLIYYRHFFLFLMNVIRNRTAYFI